MKSNYELTSYFEALGYPDATTSYYAQDLRSLTVFCRGNKENLEEILRPTPFELVGDRFAVLIADFTEASVGGGFYDAGLVIPVRYGDTVGATYRYEWEDHSWSIAFGREVWGYPKEYGDIDLVNDGDEVRGSVTVKGEPVIEIALNPTEGEIPGDFADMTLYPHLLVHAFPAADRAGFSTFEIVSRDTSKDTVVTSKVLGAGEVRLGGSLSHVQVEEVLGAAYSVSDYACAPETGRAVVIDDLLASTPAQAPA